MIQHIVNNMSLVEPLDDVACGVYLKIILGIFIIMTVWVATIGILGLTVFLPIDAIIVVLIIKNYRRKRKKED